MYPALKFGRNIFEKKSSSAQKKCHPILAAYIHTYMVWLDVLFTALGIGFLGLIAWDVLTDQSIFLDPFRRCGCKHTETTKVTCPFSATAKVQEPRHEGFRLAGFELEKRRRKVMACRTSCSHWDAKPCGGSTGSVKRCAHGNEICFYPDKHNNPYEWSMLRVSENAWEPRKNLEQISWTPTESSSPDSRSLELVENSHV